MELQEVVKGIKPFVVGWLSQTAGGAGPYAPTPHDIGGAHHTGEITDAQHGIRTLANAHAHADLSGVSANQHHSQSHVLATTAGLGGDHTVSGLTAGQYLRATGAATAAFSTIPVGDLPAHNILSATHGDTLAAAVVRGSILVGNATPKWSALAIGTAGKVLRSDGTDLAYSTSTYPDTIGAGALMVATGANAVGALGVGLTTEILVGGGAGTVPVWTTATGTGAPMRGTSPTITTSLIMSDGATIGQAAGPLVAFDDTNNYLEITGCNVGIGTTAPGNKLDVVGGSIKQSPGAYGMTNYLNANGNSYSSTSSLNPGLTVFNNGGSGVYGMDLGYNGAYRTRIFTSATTTDIAFSVNGANPPTAQSDFTDLMVIKGTGNVGIGTTGPQTALDIAKLITNPTVFANSNVGQLHVTGTNNAAGSVVKITFSETYTGAIAAAQAAIGAKFNADGSQLLFGTSNTYSGVTNTAMLIDKLGNVGIGTTAPAKALDVNGGINIRYPNGLTFRDDADSAFLNAIFVNTAEVMTFGGANISAVKIDTGYGNAITVIGSTGNVGIGTTSPLAALQIKPAANKEIQLGQRLR